MIRTFNISYANAKLMRQSLKLRLKLWAGKWLNTRWSLIKSFRTLGLWAFYILLGPKRMNFKMFCLKALTEGTLPKVLFKLSYTIIVKGRKELSNNPCLTLKKGISLVVLTK